MSTPVTTYVGTVLAVRCTCAFAPRRSSSPSTRLLTRRWSSKSFAT